MPSRQPKKKKLTFDPDQEPKFERGDLVKMLGIEGPTMLVIKVSDEPVAINTNTNDNEAESDRNGVNATVGSNGFLEGEFEVTVIWFNKSDEMQGEYDAHAFPEGLLQLVKSTVLVQGEAQISHERVRRRL